MTDTPRARKPKATTAKVTTGWTDDEKAAMRERAREAKAEAKRGTDRAASEQDLLAKIAEMSPGDRAMAERIHALITTAAPELTPRTWYGQPAYARDGKVVCFFQPADKFKTRYATLGFSDEARLDEGTFWPNAYALTELTTAVEERITALVRRAVR
jgi:uncharacterized protein YdhG (YjbR/CyaY superfamily)